VVLFHLGAAIAAEKYFDIPAFALPFSFGDAGVPFFFVLSGFIIMTAHRDDISRPARLASYIRKRLTRIYPVYWIIFVSVFLLAVASSDLRGTVPHDPLLLLRSLLLIPQDKAVVGGTGAPVLIVAWTLQYEMIFYLFFALMILNRGLGVIAGIFFLLVYFSGTTAAAFPLGLFTQDYVLLFAMGMAVATAHAANMSSGTMRPLLCAGLGAVCFLTLALTRVLQPDLLAGGKILFYGLASCLIIFGLVRAEDAGVVVGRQRWLQLLGDASYALYLLHYPLISILCKLALIARLKSLGMIGALIAYIAILGACLSAAVIFHLGVEKPLLSRLQGRRSAPAPTSVLHQRARTWTRTDHAGR
jgi:peptidoglycan/LPS O-acetylase OafA/YrhL